ncbi:MAG TPA: hypothetical protein VNO32_14505, partial [Candidatus Acidoferrum sp.]|nr:hypothetical protein [Candidatus Acidoferrum sp.]
LGASGGIRVALYCALDETFPRLSPPEYPSDPTGWSHSMRLGNFSYKFFPVLFSRHILVPFQRTRTFFTDHWP